MPIISPRLRLRPSRKGASAFAQRSATVDRLSDWTAPFHNPGNLACRFYVPEGLTGPAPLIVVLHGCTQDAAVYDHGSGWSRLADRHGFILLFPEQRRANNSMLCFNWFEAADTTRGQGEAASIRAMIDAVGAVHAIDRGRVFVTGLSAGGAMASVMLATYPEVFAGGAIIAGVAYGCATSVAEAFSCMGGNGAAQGAGLGARVRAASPHAGPWPRVQVWQGSADRTVVSSNADAIVRQWLELHRLPERPSRTETVAGHALRVWSGADGQALVEQYDIAGMAHGIPLDPGTGAGQSGQAGAHMLDVGLSSTDRIAEFFGVANGAAPMVGSSEVTKVQVAAKQIAPKQVFPKQVKAKKRASAAPAAAHGVQKIIEDALKAAGLMR
jgi:poly(hydroxyalkanoate) depolymerase family esterase